MNGASLCQIILNGLRKTFYLRNENAVIDLLYLLHKIEPNHSENIVSME